MRDFTTLDNHAYLKYTTKGCKCLFCRVARTGRRPGTIMCRVKWLALPLESRIEIAESCSD